ncbi:hypothetical protein A9Q94_11225 [Rhodobacterales bacterium 56_14_T64]|nr:hypothetical protein A9Q94_11225 [Rhodobacterales bacterium 56_14_T64]
MEILVPIVFVIVLLLPVIPFAILVMLPTYPKSRRIMGAWCLLLAVGIAVSISTFLYPHESPFIFWKAPKWHSFVIDFFLIGIPFSCSFYLWRLRRKTPEILSEAAIFMIVLVTCILSFFALKTFNKTCVFFEYWNDSGQAWCPVSWQAH